MPLKPETRKAIFDILRSSLERQCPPMVCAKHNADCYEIIGNKPVLYGSTKKIVPGMYFASTVARKDMVSFYIYADLLPQGGFCQNRPDDIEELEGKGLFQLQESRAGRPKGTGCDAEEGCAGLEETRIHEMITRNTRWCCDKN
jgi:hypothetical protein